MKTQTTKDGRSAIIKDAKIVQREILASPSIEKWCKNADPVDRTRWQGELCRVIEGAAELVWIASNDFVWIPPMEDDIRIQKGEMMRRIEDFLTLSKSESMDIIFRSPFTKSNFFEMALNAAAAINFNDPNDLVWKEWNIQTQGMTHSSEEKTDPPFESIVKITGSHTTQDLMDRLHELIDNETSPSMIGAIFFRCRELGYICKNPTEQMARAEFNISCKWSGVQNYMAQEKDCVYRKAMSFKIFEDEDLSLM